jgi:hypothetical protein
MMPLLGVQQCYSTDPVDCATDVRVSDITNMKSNWYYGEYVISEQVVSIDHDESICMRRQGSCYYTVVVVGIDLMIEDYDENGVLV